MEEVEVDGVALVRLVAHAALLAAAGSLVGVEARLAESVAAGEENSRRALGRHHQLIANGTNVIVGSILGCQFGRNLLPRRRRSVCILLSGLRLCGRRWWRWRTCLI